MSTGDISYTGVGLPEKEKTKLLELQIKSLAVRDPRLIALKTERDLF